MIVVGVGVGPKMLTQEAIEAISNAPVVYGSKRAIELAQDHIKSEAHPIKSFKNLHLLPADAVILSTGDPMFSGLGKFASENDRVITGVSSIQAACARFHVEMSNLAMITAHGRDPAPAKEALISELELGKNIFMLPADTFGPVEVAEILEDMNIDARICIYENIGYPDERAVCGSTAEPPANTSNMYCLLVIR
ncbi:cobalt-precorrin-7 (C(5))-methyltransferase [Methanolobus zinderi]|jgi:cobalt-precorrin-7 (C5)-methyltransferase|uniref:Cobalt-precorrin-7 (C(5))-methyltransferase n=1 Tax=Methanolobus zinderi TaxID=536044 RepID=A0A7D5IQW6_9EURY|nr:cobalt-precorrin-7 (C(5))-methyltransferase [Methanolobus zinderi]KXS44758.1 MAG: cobalt-precorrin-6Y C(5)-methyltransferase [Methanolobus sp. T82-4]QLC50847.1 cobalt-precorrin-7 (C(5))-methyltransferase [Methanolobus zinderi]